MNAQTICDCGNFAASKLCSYDASTWSRFERAHKLFGKLKGRVFCGPCMSVLYNTAAAERVGLLRQNLR